MVSLDSVEKNRSFAESLETELVLLSEIAASVGVDFDEVSSTCETDSAMHQAVSVSLAESRSAAVS